jgi:creatinine amidohydrolase/Fe(II)-dependent formamide hydrolase-like protein
VDAYAVHLLAQLEDERLSELFGELPPRQFHACARETSLIYHFHPDLVKVREISPDLPPEGEGLRRLTRLAGQASWGWATEEVSSAGFIGDPQLASPDAGAALAGWLADRICEVLATIIDGP